MSNLQPEMTLEEVMQAAFSALLRGDLAERDRLCELALLAFNGNPEPLPGDTLISNVKGVTKQ